MSQTTVPNPTRVDAIADGIYRLATAIDLPGGPGAFSFNQYLIDDEPLPFHTRLSKLFPLDRITAAAHSGVAAGGKPQ